MGVLFFFGCSSVSQRVAFSSKTEANQKLCLFPEKIPGISSVIKLEVNNAQYCLVHIPQIHWAPCSSDSVKQEIVIVQNQIYDVLCYLQDKLFLEELYDEGIVEDPENHREIFDEFYKNHLLIVENAMKEMPKEYLTEIDKRIVENDVESNYFFEYSASRRMERERGFLLKPADRVREKNAFFSFYLSVKFMIGLEINLSEEEMEKIETKLNCLHNDRENVLLQAIVNREDNFAVTVYGRGHYFFDNIERWNKTYPNQKFSHIILIPSSLKDGYQNSFEPFEYYYYE